jgi:membrane-associated phospholipid phosphatase
MIAQVARTTGKVVVALAVLYGVMVGIGYLLTHVIEHSGFVREDNHVEKVFAQHRDKTLNDVTYVLSGLGNTVAIVGALVVVAIFLRIALKRWREPIFIVLAVSAQALVFLLVTLSIDRQRPTVHRLDSSPPTSSYPSGHTGAATALFVSSALLVAWYVRKRWLKTLAVTVFLAVPLLVAFGRLYRGMHHPTDVAAALLNGLVCIAIAAAFVLPRRLGGESATNPRQAPMTAGAR